MSMIVIYYRSVSDTQGYSSVGRTLVSKTKCRGFESFCPCDEKTFRVFWMSFCFRCLLSK